MTTGHSFNYAGEATWSLEYDSAAEEAKNDDSRSFDSAGPERQTEGREVVV
jgi:hypothetical protein